MDPFGKQSTVAFHLKPGTQVYSKESKDSDLVSDEINKFSLLQEELP